MIEPQGKAADSLRLSGTPVADPAPGFFLLGDILTGRFLLHKWISLGRLMSFSFLTVLMAVVATYRHFGFDLESTRYNYPQTIADGWGLWYWLAQLRFDFNSYFLLINLCLSIQILLLAFPKRPKQPVWSASVILTAYCILWFLFGQARYGMAIALITAAAACDSLLLLFFAGVIGVIIHKAIAGGLLLILGWVLLRGKRYGIIIALGISGLLTFIILQGGNNLLVIAGYAGYIGLDSSHVAATPLKYYFCLVVLFVGCIRKEPEARILLILALLFLPTSYSNALAARAFSLFALVLLISLRSGKMSKPLTYLLLIPFVADLIRLVFFYDGAYL
jgi:hypothetical protein